jgi:hypothetical protein
MKTRRRQLFQVTPRRRLACVTFLVICTLIGHSFDACAAHLGGSFARSTSTQQITTEQPTEEKATAPQAQQPCPDEQSSACQICSAHDKSHQDACELLSETAVLNASSQHQIEYQAVTLTATVAVIPAMPQVIALSGCLHGRAGPPPAVPLSVVLRSSLPSRAPPVSA